jgi:uncharacterized protein YggE
MRHRAFALALLLPLVSGAQAAGNTAAPPQITTSATADVQLKPDRATLSFSVESRGATAAKAGIETARRQRAVLDTLRALGIAADQMTTASIEISPEYAYNVRPPTLTGYIARNTVRVEVRDIEKLGALIDAALAREASGIGSLAFNSSKSDEARRQALELAVARAKGDAESMARAAGGALGPLMELNAMPSYSRPIAVELSSARAMAVRGAEQTPVAPGEITVSATVTARWAFIAK